MPEKIDRLVATLSQASGMSPEEVRAHHHFLQAFSFARMVEAYRPHYIHSYFFYEGTLFALVASHLLDIPRGVSCYADHMLKDYPLKVVRLHLSQCALVIATSEQIKCELLNIAPDVSPGRIIIKPNAIDTAKFEGAHRDTFEKDRPFRMVAVGRIEPKKGQIYLVEAMQKLREQNVNVQLQMIGGVDNNSNSKNYAQEIESRIHELNLQKMIHFEGQKSPNEIRNILKNADLFVAPFVETEYGDKDGIPTSLLEAMASGLPVVATDAGSISEVIEHGRDGLIIQQRDSSALASVIPLLIKDSQMRSELGKNASKKVRDKFDINVCEPSFHTRILRLIDSRRDSGSIQDKDRKWGVLRKLHPVNTNWGFEQGLPIDRYYIESFLMRHSNDIQGHVLEIEDDMYMRKFGGDRVTTSDILHITEGNPKATIIGDLTSANHIPSGTFDCIIITQTLHLIYDVRLAIENLYRILKPGGVLLATFPGITRISHTEWSGSWYWGFTTGSARRIFEEAFAAECVHVQAFGNVLTAISFLHGLPMQDLNPEELDYHDPDYQVLITVRSIKQDSQRHE